MNKAHHHLARLSETYRSHSTRSARVGIERLPTLRDGVVDHFRRECFKPELPTTFPRGWFSQLPAVNKWFTKSSSHERSNRLDPDYWNQYGDVQVPLELTRPGPLDYKGEHSDTFSRFQAPLSDFLEWSVSDAHGATPERLYLAQATTSDLPQSLRDDIPTPEIVLQAGRGDIYDTNIWIGHASSYTPLHRDPNPNLFVHLAGKKVVRLFEPDVGAGIFRSVQMQLGRRGSDIFRGDEMMQGPEKRLLEEAVWKNDHLPGYEADLEGGDGLFIPKGWWHSIKGAGRGMTGSVSSSLRTFEQP
ncbi:MAG: hypothetical protein M1837_004941 [Sclerophora amabilis]|nr:MAG: hypothetical protein M1837_004941 [Sclerophora amabilis]